MNKLFCILLVFALVGCSSIDDPVESDPFNSILDRKPDAASDFKLSIGASRSAQLLLSVNTKNMVAYGRARQAEAQNRGVRGGALKEIDAQRADPAFFVSQMTNRIKGSFDSISLINDINQYQRVDNNYLIIVDIFFNEPTWSTDKSILKIGTPILDRNLKLISTPSARGEFLFGFYSEPYAVKIKQETDYYIRIFDQYERNLSSIFPSRQAATTTQDKADRTSIDQCVRSALLIVDVSLKKSAIRACGN